MQLPSSWLENSNTASLINNYIVIQEFDCLRKCSNWIQAYSQNNFNSLSEIDSGAWKREHIHSSKYNAQRIYIFRYINISAVTWLVVLIKKKVSSIVKNISLYGFYFYQKVKSVLTNQKRLIK